MILVLYTVYGCEAWSILAHCHKKRDQILQNKCLKLIYDVPRYRRISELHGVAEIPYNAELLDDHVQ